MKLSRWVSAGAFALGLAACGGGGSSPPPTGGSSGGGTPTPPPPPPITYTAFDNLVGNQTFDTGCVNIDIRNGFLFADTSRIAYADGFPIFYDEPSDTWTFDGDRFQSSFGPTERDTSAPATFLAYSRTLQSGFTERFAIITPELTGSGATVLPEYMRAQRMITLLDDGTLLDIFCHLGVPTSVNDTLPSSNVTYDDFRFLGSAFLFDSAGNRSQYSFSDSTARITANPATGRIELRMNFVGREFGPSGTSDTPVDFGERTGAADLEVDTSEVTQAEVLNYTGPLLNDQGGGAGQFSGTFYGPQGQETAIAIALFEGFNDGSRLELAGVFVGGQ